MNADRLPPFDGVEDAQMAANEPRVVRIQSIPMCACFSGLCRCEVIDGRTATGQRCKAFLQDHIGAE